MSKWLAFLAVPVVGALAAWNLTLSSEIDALRDELSQSAKGQAAKGPSASSRSEKQDGGRAGDESRPIPARANPEAGVIADRMDTFEKRLAALAAGGSSASAGSGAPVGELPPEILVSPAFRQAVDRVMEQIEQEKKLDRMKRQAEAMAKLWLRDVNVTDDQRTRVESTLVETLKQSQAIRDDETRSDEQRRSDRAAREQSRHDQVAGLLDVQQMEVVGPRLQARFRKAPVAADSDAVKAARGRAGEIRDRLGRKPAQNDDDGAPK
ncbi:MAG: hypothetical protein ACKVXR_02290 [Planctomycetota bacterium]